MWSTPSKKPQSLKIIQSVNPRIDNPGQGIHSAASGPLVLTGGSQKATSASLQLQWAHEGVVFRSVVWVLSMLNLYFFRSIQMRFSKQKPSFARKNSPKSKQEMRSEIIMAYILCTASKPYRAMHGPELAWVSSGKYPEKLTVTLGVGFVNNTPNKTFHVPLIVFLKQWEVPCLPAQT